MELGIALFLNDSWIRPFFGDFLVVILLYCFFKSFIYVSVKACLSYVLMISLIVETLQHFDFVKIIGLENITVVKVILGTSFSWIDIIMYTFGVVFVYIMEVWVAATTAYSIKSKESEG
jgi:hypothetical protein